MIMAKTGAINAAVLTNARINRIVARTKGLPVKTSATVNRKKPVMV
jgi:hypothetical protein